VAASPPIAVAEPPVDAAADAKSQAAEAAGREARLKQHAQEKTANGRPFDKVLWLFYDVLDLFAPGSPIGRAMAWVVRKTLVEPPLWVIVVILVAVSVGVSLITAFAPMAWVQGVLGNNGWTQRFLTDTQVVKTVVDQGSQWMQSSVLFKLFATAVVLGAAPTLFLARVFFDPDTARTLLTLMTAPCVWLAVGWLALNKANPSFGGMDKEQTKIAILTGSLAAVYTVVFMLLSVFRPSVAGWLVGHTRPGAFLTIALAALGVAAWIAIVHLEGYRRKEDGNVAPDGPSAAFTHIASQFVISMAAVMFVLVSPLLNRAAYARMRVMSPGAY
jgi:hypothetical protein